MPHESIQPSEGDRYYEGDALDVPFTFLDKEDQPVDITGMTVEFRVKRNLTDSDEESYVEKTGTEGEPGDDISFTDPANGECIVSIDTDDTTNVLTENEIRSESVIVDWHIRVIDGDGDRVTSETGTWEIFAS